MNKYLKDNYNDIDVYDEHEKSDYLNYDDYFEEEDDNEFNNLEENYLNCILPTINDTFHNFLYTIIIVNISLKIALIINDALNLRWKKQFNCLFKIIGGLYLVYDFFRDVIYIGNILVLGILLGNLIILLTNKYNRSLSSKCVWLFCLSILLINELVILFYNLKFRRLRPIIMLLIMKFISLNNYLNYDEIKENRIKINFIDSLTYILHPQCLPLGGWNPPFHSINNNIQNQLQSFTLIENFLNYSKPLLLSIIFLICSNCIIFYLMGLIEYSVLPFIYQYIPTIFYYILKSLLNAYFVALQFRCSHYFISYTMQYIHYLWDYNIQITKPLSIEFPRSLVEVVIVWNIPMHEWLKNHLYKVLSIKFGDTKSRFLTFILSSLIHGYDFRIWSVLIVLSFLTWIEIKLRKKLSIKLNSCIDARKCDYDMKDNKNWFYELINNLTIKNYKSNYKCKKLHHLTPFNSLIVNLINLFFSILCIIHLAFLGSAFDGKESNSTFEHVHEIWSFLNYYSLILFVPTFIIYKLL